MMDNIVILESTHNFIHHPCRCNKLW